MDDDPPSPNDESSVSSVDSKDSDEVETSRVMRNFGFNVKKAKKLIEKNKIELEKYRKKVNNAISPMGGFAKKEWKWISEFLKKKDKKNMNDKEKVAGELLQQASEIYDKMSEKCLSAFGKDKMSDIYKELWSNNWPQGLFEVFIIKFFKFERLHCAYRWRKQEGKLIKKNYLKLVQQQLDLQVKISEDKVLQNGDHKMKDYFKTWIIKVLEFDDK